MQAIAVLCISDNFFMFLSCCTHHDVVWFLNCNVLAVITVARRTKKGRWSVLTVDR